MIIYEKFIIFDITYGAMHELLARKIQVFFNSSVDNGFHGLYMVLPGNCKGALS